MSFRSILPTDYSHYYNIQRSEKDIKTTTRDGIGTITKAENVTTSQTEVTSLETIKWMGQMRKPSHKVLKKPSFTLYHNTEQEAWNSFSKN